MGSHAYRRAKALEAEIRKSKNLETLTLANRELERANGKLTDSLAEARLEIERLETDLQRAELAESELRRELEKTRLHTTVAPAQWSREVDNTKGA